MSWTTISGVSDEQVASVPTGSNVQVTIGSLRPRQRRVRRRHRRTNEQVIPVLVERAPQLLARIERVKVSTVNAAVVAPARGEEPLPGIERGKARGSLVVRPDRNAGEAVEPLAQVGVITWDGRPFAQGRRLTRANSAATSPAHANGAPRHEPLPA